MQQKTNGFQFLRRTVWLSVLTAAVLGLAVASRWGWPHGAGFFFGAFWALANFVLLGSLLVHVTSPKETQPGVVAGLGMLKLCVLTLGAVVLVKQIVPGPPFALGIAWPLAVLLLRSVGAQWWRRQSRPEAPDPGAVNPT